MCPQCHSKMIIDNTCLKCGTVDYPEGFTPYLIVSDYEKTDEGIKERKIHVNNKRGMCRNCLRPDLALLNDDLCSSCYSQVRTRADQHFVIGSKRYEEQLKRYRENKWPHRFKTAVNA
jgi:DNA-directed RNA polymerase subunit M/transcription elongation factor TFIIS